MRKERDASMVNTFRIGPLSWESNHKPLYLHIATRSSHIWQHIRVKNENTHITWYCYQKATLYANEVENHVMNLSLSKHMKKSWEQLKDVIIKVQYQHFSVHVGGYWMLSLPHNACFNEESKDCLNGEESVVSISNHVPLLEQVLHP